MLMRRAIGAAFVALLLLPGCGSDKPASSSPPVQDYSRRSNAPDMGVPRATPADYRRPMAQYRRHVGRQLTAMLGDVAALRGAVARDDLGGAREAWLRAHSRYETIGAAYGAFGSLDAAINGRPDGLQGGIRSPEFQGLHRVELALWGRRSTADAARPAARLRVAVTKLRDRIPTIEIDPLDYALRSHEVLEDALHLELSGQADRWSGAALYALRSELVGTTVVLRTLRPMIVPRDTTGRLPEARRALRRVEAEVRGLERGDGSLPRWDTLGQRTRERVAGLTAGAAEELAYVPELIDPRPPRPSQRALG
jgi:iron uptake system EfeUOB component EfeO/EfeM